MRIGVGLSSTIPGAPASLTLDWTRRADAGPFSTLATLDRLVYDSLDSLTALRAVPAGGPVAAPIGHQVEHRADRA